MKKEDKLLLFHIKESCEYIIEFISHLDYENFIKSRLYQDGVIREIIVIGEAVNKVSEETKNKYIEVPWKDIIGMRNKIIHEYFGIDLEAVWKTAEQDTSDLLAKINNIIKKEGI